jgi:transposase, IS5 family
MFKPVLTKFINLNHKLCLLAMEKEHKPYEFRNKSSLAYTRKSGIIVGARAIDGNAYDGHT